MEGRPPFFIRGDNCFWIGGYKVVKNGYGGTASGTGVMKGCETGTAAVGCRGGMGLSEGVDCFPVTDACCFVNDGGNLIIGDMGCRGERIGSREGGTYLRRNLWMGRSFTRAACQTGDTALHCSHCSNR